MEYHTRYNRYQSIAETFAEPSLVGDDVKELSTKELIAKFLDGQPQGMMSDPSDFDFPPDAGPGTLKEKMAKLRDATEGYWDPTRARGYDIFQATEDLKHNRAQLAAASKLQEVQEQVDQATAASPDKADIAQPGSDPAGGLNG